MARIEAHMEVVNVSKAFADDDHDPFVLRDVSFSVGEGDFVSIVGPSGCGKSTLLKMVAGLEKPTAGEIRINGERLNSTQSGISMVFQSGALFPWRNVLANVEFGLELKHIPASERRSLAEGYLDLVGLSGCEHMYAKQLSAGMKQRVGLARALAVDPEIILMDEAFSSLDEFTAEILRSEVSEIHEETEKTFLLVTNNLHEAIQLGDRVIVMSARPGRVRSIFDIQLARPRDKTHSEFVRIHHSIFDHLREELENSIVKHRIKALPAVQVLYDLESRE